MTRKKKKEKKKERKKREEKRERKKDFRNASSTRRDEAANRDVIVIFHSERGAR